MNDPSLFSVVAGSAEPIYRQLVAQVRRCVADAEAMHVVSVAFRSRGVAAMTLSRLR